MGQVMSFVNELADDVWKAVGFHDDYETILSANFMLDVPNIKKQTGDGEFNDAVVSRLLQCASIFSASDDDTYRDAAQRISTALLSPPDDENMSSFFGHIQGRLGNFPAIPQKSKTAIARSDVPLSLQYEFSTSLDKQTVRIRDKKWIFSRFQVDAWTALKSAYSLSLSAPTSAGKSFVLVNYLVDRLINENISSVAYIVPTRALINQVAEDFERQFRLYGFDRVTITTVPVDMGDVADKKTVYVLTQERLETLLLDCPQTLLEIVVIDEAQMLGSSGRGVLLESVIDRFRTTNRNVQTIFSGPLLENPEYFGDVFALKDFKSCETTQPSVTQNIVRLDYSTHPIDSIKLSLFSSGEQLDIGAVSVPFPLRTDLDKLSYLPIMFGKSGSNLIYAGGKAQAEKIAIKLAGEIKDDRTIEALTELIGFVRKHVHGRSYALANALKKGVAFHYGHMPSLLRKELEKCFKERKIQHLVCTSTLLYGLNLPAKNIFLMKPTTGRGTPISGPDFWNLAGRAGRLGKELEGNVFLIDYDEWETKPLSQNRSARVESALRKALINKTDEITAFLEDPNIGSQVSSDIEIAVGKLVIDARNDKLDETIERYIVPDNRNVLTAIQERIVELSDSLDLPTKVLNRNIGLSIFRQKALFDYMSKRLGQIDPMGMIPAHPAADDYKQLSQNYLRAFKHIHTYVLGYPKSDNRHRFFSPLALRWMQGNPLPLLIESSIRYHKTANPSKSKAVIIRETMENVEEHLRFRYVRLFTCYNSVLEIALERHELNSLVDTIPNIPLYLEMGASSGAMINLMALGLSRTTSTALADYITDKEMSIDGTRNWLTSQDFEGYDISPICQREIEMLLSKESVD